MELYKQLGLQKPKFRPNDYITDNKGQSFEIRFFEWDFEREEYYYFPMPDTFAGKIYEGDAQLTDPPKSTSMEVYELLFGGRKE
jgi:hypothetical protein